MTVYPHNASRRGAVAACERSLRRLKTDRLDLCLLHWRGSIPLIAERHDTTAAQVALAWLLAHDALIAIPRSGKTEHVRENRAALDLNLTDQDLAELDCAFPPPTEARPLEML